MSIDSFEQCPVERRDAGPDDEYTLEAESVTTVANGQIRLRDDIVA